jgi:hypothetical protein
MGLNDQIDSLITYVSASLLTITGVKQFFEIDPSDDKQTTSKDGVAFIHLNKLPFDNPALKVDPRRLVRFQIGLMGTNKKNDTREADLRKLSVNLWEWFKTIRTDGKLGGTCTRWNEVPLGGTLLQAVRKPEYQYVWFEIDVLFPVPVEPEES